MAQTQRRLRIRQKPDDAGIVRSRRAPPPGISRPDGVLGAWHTPDIRTLHGGAIGNDLWLSGHAGEIHYALAWPAHADREFVFDGERRGLARHHGSIDGWSRDGELPFGVVRLPRSDACRAFPLTRAGSLG